MKALKYILPIFVLFIAVAAWTYYQDRQVLLDEQAQKQAENAEFRESFEVFLNDFLSEIAQQARDYKKQRKVISELVNPKNFTAPEYVEENYTLIQNLIPELEAQMNEIMAGFETANQTIQALLKDKSPEETTLILEEWTKLKQEQAGMYLTFFSFEQQVLSAYQELMAVYYDTQGRFRFDVETKAVVFDNPQDELNVNAKRRVLQGLLRAQADALDEK